MNKTTILPSKRRDSRAISFAENKNIFSSLSKQGTSTEAITGSTQPQPTTTQHNKTKTIDLDRNDESDFNERVPMTTLGSIEDAPVSSGKGSVTRVT